MLLDHLGLMLMDGRGYALTSFRAASNEMNFVVQSLCLPGGYVLHSFLWIFSLYFWDAGSLLWTGLQEFGLLEFVRWCSALWRRLPFMLFEMIFKLQQDHINSVWGRLLGQRLLLML